MINSVKRSAAAVLQAAIILTAMLAIAGCAGMMAESRFKEDAAAKYVFNVPAEKLIDETATYLSGGAFGAALTGGAAMSSLEIDREKLTVAGAWKPGKMSRSRTAALITKVDDGHSSLVMNNETHTMDSKTGDWGNSRLSRASVYEIEMIKRLDPKAAAEIEAGAKKAAQEAKKK
jgi:hypothetical protein